MNTFTYWPYDEVSLEAHGFGQLTIKTPWMEAKTSASIFSPANIAKLNAKLRDKHLSQEDVGFVSDFFRHFHHYPLAYILPTPKTTTLLDNHTIADNTLLNLDFKKTLETILSSLPEGQNFTENDREKLFKILPRTSWGWDQKAALNFARIDKRIHPESLFSVARRYHILELMTNDLGRDIFMNMKKRGSSRFKAAIARVVRQNHYVTEKCQEALEPALFLAGHAAFLLMSFMNEEKDHDKILKKALHHLGVKPQDIEVSIQTRALMATLKYMAMRNFLAFSMAIDAFERNNYEEIDPIAKLLIDGGFEKASEFINLHMKINERGGHDNIAQQFLGFMDLCEQDYALEAFHLMEVLSVIMCSISKSADRQAEV